MRIRLAWCSGLAVMGMMLGGARSVVAQQPTGQVVRLGDGETLTISGFVSASWVMNSGLFVFGNGQNAEYAALAQPATDKTYLDGDVRNTRIRFEFAGSPVIGKWSPRAVIESDFFGANNGAPPFGDEQPQLRVRFAYADLTNGRTTLRIGQFWSPMFGEVPVSVTHLAFPLGYGAAGMIGWRYPGIFLYHDLAPGKPLAIQLQLAALEGSGPAGNASDVATGTGIGEASGMPQLEARLNFSKRKPNFSWSAYVVGHIDWKDTTGTGVAGNNLTGTGVELGGNVTAGKLTVHGNFYTGKAIGQQFAHIAPTALNQQNVKGLGAWVQGGYEVNPHWSAWLFYGMDDPDEAQFATDNPGVVGGYLRHKNEDLAGMLRYRAGRYAVGVEYFKANTTWSTVKQKASQVSLSVLYTI